MADYDFTLDTIELAEQYERVSAEHQLESGKELVGLLEIGAGDTVLDVGAGTGALAAYVAETLAPGARVHGIDPLPERIGLAAKRAGPLLSFEVGSAYDLDGFADESFDVVYLNQVLHWLPEKVGPLTQFRRLLRPGGRLGIWTIAGGHPSQIRRVKDIVFTDPAFAAAVRPEDSGPQPLDRDQLDDALDAAGFARRTIDLIDNASYLPTPDDVIDFIEASSFGNFLHRLPPEMRARARDRIRADLDGFQTERGVALGGKSLRAIAIK